MAGIAFCAVTCLSGVWHEFCPLQSVITDFNAGQVLKAARVTALGADAGAKDIVRTYCGVPADGLRVIEGDGELISTLDPGGRGAAPALRGAWPSPRCKPRRGGSYVESGEYPGAGRGGY
jgi:hypothetical protein